MSDYKASETVSVSTDVIRDVARITALAWPGVLTLIDQPVIISVPPREVFRGVDVTLEDQKANINLHVVASDSISLIELGQSLQRSVADAIEQMCGVDVAAVNIVFEDVRQA